ncbi:hypothetical protein PVAP13_8KG096500 [Panicum virgatum]|uniref:F-box domain-containing protein n=1 Tax=Panicum virgatum TaxID=38727 RepID=A0A8T0PS36_PANVG|nr:hypothetical protein PVAP13_8KG096500 [Panicum virgatum]
MPPRRKGGKGRRAARPGAGRISIDELPDEVLHHVLSFLPAQEAVRTCVLARRWRHLWRSATGLRISCGPENEAAVNVKKLRDFVDHLFLLRGGSPLDTCQFNLLDINEDDDDTRRIHLWIRHVLMCRVRVLSLNMTWYSECWTKCFSLDGLPLVSQHLKRLELSSLYLDDSFLDFSSCPALEVIEIKECEIPDLDRILSRSLKSLSITGCCEFSEFHRFHVYAPNLVSLWLEVFIGRVPILDRMPSLVEAVVRIGRPDDFCHLADSGNCEDEHCPGCYGADGDTGCVLLQGLSEAQSLVLISDTKMFIFRRDLKCCPIFSNLKTLLLNEYWCVPDDFSALTCILEHSPVLEKLTLQLFCEGPKSNVHMKGSPDPKERSNAISEHLKVVEVKCEVVDDRVINILKFLNKLAICKLQCHCSHFLCF